MKISFEVRPRQTGKTTSLANMVTKNDLLIVPNRQTRDYVFDILLRCKFPNFYNHIVAIANEHDTFSRTHGIEYSRILIDEYLFFPTQIQELLWLTLRFHTDEIIIKTTSSKLFDKCLFYLVSKAKEDNIFVDDFVEYLHDDYKEEARYLYKNFLTDPDTELNVFYDRIFQQYGTENFSTEFMGKLFD